MKLAPDQLVTWFFTASRASGLFPFPDEAEASARAALAKAPAGERREIASGLKESIRHFVNTPQVWRRFIEVNAALQAKGLPTLEEMDAELERKEATVLKRGAIRNDDEARMVMELLDNLESGLTDRQRSKLGKMMYAYETRPRTA